MLTTVFLLIACALIAVAAVPLLLKLVPPHPRRPRAPGVFRREGGAGAGDESGSRGPHPPRGRAPRAPPRGRASRSRNPSARAAGAGAVRAREKTQPRRAGFDRELYPRK